MSGQCSVSSTVVTFYKLCQEHMNHRLYACRTLLLVKPPLPHKMQKNNVFFVVSGGRADNLSLSKTKLHNCGRAGILFKQVKKIRQNRQMYATFPKSQKKNMHKFCV